jgi:hypothetical protein
MGEPTEAQNDVLLAELADALNNALGRLPCIHGFFPSVQVELIDGKTVKPTITFRCYECRQTMSYPPRMGALIDGILSEFNDRFLDAGLNAHHDPFRQNR